MHEGQARFTTKARGHGVQLATVTVIIPTFNRRPLLLAALSSVFSQTYQDYEVLVVDDGSTDGTEAALAPLSTKTRYCWKPNDGEASARNRGIREANTPYIAFLDSDDLWEPTFLHTTISTLESDPALAMEGRASRMTDGPSTLR